MQFRHNFRPFRFVVLALFTYLLLEMVAQSVCRIIPSSEITGDRRPLRMRSIRERARSESSETAMNELKNMLAICERIRKYSTQASTSSTEGLVSLLCKQVNRTRARKARHNNAHQHQNHRRENSDFSVDSSLNRRRFNFEISRK